MPNYGGKTTLRKNDELNIKFRNVYWLPGCNSGLSVILYKQVIHQVWSYDIRLQGFASYSYIDVIQHYQIKVLKCIVSTPFYVHCDLGIETVTVII
jgi:hypothetical protein